MSDGKGPDEARAGVSKFMEALSGRIAKITYGLVALGALVKGGQGLIGTVEPYFSGAAPKAEIGAPTAAPPTVAQGPCYRLVLKAASTVSMGMVRAGNFNWFELVFENQCPEVFFIRVEFKAISEGIVIQGGTELWPTYTIQTGERLVRFVSPPKYNLLMEQPRPIQIRTLVYRKDNERLLYEDTSHIQISADDPGAAPRT